MECETGIEVLAPFPHPVSVSYRAIPGLRAHASPLPRILPPPHKPQPVCRYSRHASNLSSHMSWLHVALRACRRASQLRDRWRETRPHCCSRSPWENSAASRDLDRRFQLCSFLSENTQQHHFRKTQCSLGQVKLPC